MPNLQTTIDIEDDNYMVLIQKYPREYQKYWNTVMVIPVSELLKSVIEGNRQLLLFGVVFVLIGILFIFVFARSISTQIKKVSDHAYKLKTMDFEKSLEMNSQISEIETLSSTMNTMQTGIRSFLHYVPKELVKMLIRDNQEAKISGRNTQVTLMFTDIAKFSRFSETLSPLKLAQVLSNYFQKIDVLIKQNNGVIDKFIGDAAMAIWGAPVDNVDHALDACRCGLDIIKKVNGSKNKEFDTRIAIHTGDVVVGNMGSKDRFNYTAIGKEVNIANRLEGVNKLYSTNIIISDSTYDHVKDEFLCRPLDKVIVVGISYSIQIYELLDYSRKVTKEFKTYIKTYCKTHKLYQQQQFKLALEGFELLAKKNPKDKVVLYYIKMAKNI